MSDISPDEGYGQDQGQQQSRGADALKGEAQAAREKVGEAAQTVRAEAAHFADAAREKTAEKVDQGKEAVTTAVGDFADAIRKAGEELANKDQTLAARLASQAADGLQSLSRTVSEQRPDQMLDAVRRFGRDNPTAFLAGAVLAGVALGRFARSSAHGQEAEQTSRDDGYAEAPVGGVGAQTLGAEATAATAYSPETPYSPETEDGGAFAASALAAEGGVFPDEPLPSEGLGVLGDDDETENSPSSVKGFPQ